MDETAFRTDAGEPVPAVTAAEMRRVDEVAVEEFGIEVLQMMEHAGRALAAAVRKRVSRGARRPDAGTGTADSAGPVTVLAGNGGNGGGGLCAARHLRNRGVEVRVVLDRPPGDLGGPAAHHHETLAAMGVPVAVGPDGVADDTTALVDALVGYGLSGPLSGTAAELAETTAAASAVLSLDVPSGVDATTGEAPGVAVEPDCVVTLALPKTGLAGASADLLLADIGLPAGVYDRLDVPVFEFDDYVVALCDA